MRKPVLPWTPLLVAAVLALAAAGVGAQAPPAGAAPAQRPAQAPPNFLFEAARSVGVKQCLPAVARLAAQAVNGATAHDVMIDWDRAAPDAGAFFGVVGASYGGPVVLTTVSTIPETQGRCTVLAERITAAPASCRSVAERELQGYTGAPLLPQMTVYSASSDPGAVVVLIDAPPHCLVIRRHVQYKWDELTRR